MSTMMSTMTTERRKKIEDHIVKSYFTKSDGIRHGSNGWDIVHGSSDKDIPTVLAYPNWDNYRVVIRWFIPDEVSYINPDTAKVSAYYDLVVISGWFDPSNSELELSKANEKIEELNRCLNQANDIIDEWKSNTCCETPTEARKHIEELMQENADLQVKSMKALRSPVRVGIIPRNTDRYFKCVNHSLNHILYGDGSTTYGRSLEGIQKYLDKNGYSCVMDAIDQLEVENDELKGNLRSLSNRNDRLGDTITKNRSYILELQKEIAAWQDATGRKTPEQVKNRILELLGIIDKHLNTIDSLRKEHDWDLATIKILTDIIVERDTEISKWKKATERDTPEEAEKRIDGILDDLSKADDDIIDLGVEIKKLQDRIKASSRNMLWITSNGLLISESDKTVDVLEAQIEEASEVISEWQNATGCKLPSMAKEKIEHYERRLGNAVQAASCAAKHLENITF